MILTTYRRYRAGSLCYTHLLALQTGGYVDHRMALSLTWYPGLFRTDWKRGRQ